MIQWLKNLKTFAGCFCRFSWTQKKIQKASSLAQFPLATIHGKAMFGQSLGLSSKVFQGPEKFLISPHALKAAAPFWGDLVLPKNQRTLASLKNGQI